MCDNLGIPDSNEPKVTTYLLSDGMEYSNLVCRSLEEIADIIKADTQHFSENELEETEYTIRFKKMTLKEIEELPEWGG